MPPKSLYRVHLVHIEKPFESDFYTLASSWSEANNNMIDHLKEKKIDSLWNVTLIESIPNYI